MNNQKSPQILVTPNGPYVVSGDIAIAIQTIVANEAGESWEWEQGHSFEAKSQYALCRCGQSSTAPYCDGTHVHIGFDGTETASHIPYEQQKTTIAGPTITLDDVRPLCAVGRFCDAVLNAWDATPQSDQPDKQALVIHQAMRCPSGRLVVRDTSTGTALEPPLKISIGVVEDAPEGCSGPLWVRGGIPVQSQNGEAYEQRNRVTLCRCGQSKNKPFCDGTHIEIKYQDKISL